MAFKKDNDNAKSFSFTKLENFDYILEEQGNTSINLRKIDWGDKGNFKLDIRKWSYQEGQERAMKGITLNKEGADELALALVTEGYGNTSKLRMALENRSDDNTSYENNYVDDDEEEYYDPKELIS